MIDLTHYPLDFRPRVSANYFFDTEFYQPDTDTIELISIGVVCADGREFYAVSDEFDERTMGFWVRKNVIRRLGTQERMPLSEIARRMDAFVSHDPYLRFFVKGGDGKDWQMLLHIFGGEKNFPHRFPRHFTDIETMLPKVVTVKKVPLSPGLRSGSRDVPAINPAVAPDVQSPEQSDFPADFPDTSLAYPGGSESGEILAYREVRQESLAIDLPEHPGPRHNALADAVWTRSIWWQFISINQQSPSQATSQTQSQYPSQLSLAQATCGSDALGEDGTESVTSRTRKRASKQDGESSAPAKRPRSPRKPKTTSAQSSS